jgi:hypothetical protein
VANVAFKKHSSKQVLTKKRMAILLNVSYYSFSALRIKLQMIPAPISGSLSPCMVLHQVADGGRSSNMEEIGQGADNSSP